MRGSFLLQQSQESCSGRLPPLIFLLLLARFRTQSRDAPSFDKYVSCVTPKGVFSLHPYPNVKKYTKRFQVVRLCLVTGEKSPIAPLLIFSLSHSALVSQTAMTRVEVGTRTRIKLQLTRSGARKRTKTRCT